MITNIPCQKEWTRIANPADLRKLPPLDMAQTPMGKQLKVLELINRELRGKALVVNTVFDAWFTIRRYLLKEAMPKVMAEYPDVLESAIKVVNQNLIQYALACLKSGASGIFYAIAATGKPLPGNSTKGLCARIIWNFWKRSRGKGIFTSSTPMGKKYT